MIELSALSEAGTFARRVSRTRALTTSFVANAFSQSIGLALMTGAAVRMRGYKRAGDDAPMNARNSAIVSSSSDPPR